MSLEFLRVLKLYLNIYTIPISRISEAEGDLETWIGPVLP